MNVLVTGGAGFIGLHTVERLVGLGHHVTVLDALVAPVHPPGVVPQLPSGVRFVQGDVRDPECVRDALTGVDAVYHFAAYQDYLPDFSKFYSVNSVGTALLFEVIVAEKLPVVKVVVASSQAVAGEGLYNCPEHGPVIPLIRSGESLSQGAWDHGCPQCPAPLSVVPAPEDVANAQNQYAMSKYSQELMTLSLGSRYGIPAVALRYSIVQGPRQSLYNAYSGACRIFCLSYASGGTPTAYEDGESLRDYVNIEDAVDANILVLEHPDADGKVFNVGGGTEYTVMEFGRLVAAEFRSSDEPRLTGEYRFGDTRHAVSDISALRKLGWRPRHPPEKSIHDYAQWLATQEADFRGILEDAHKVMTDHEVLLRANPSLPT